jgi:hypothetical protein
MVEQVKERARNLEMSFRPATFANWTPSWVDLIVVSLSWVLVVAALRTATIVVTAERGILYFLLYAVVGATVFGMVVPLLLMVFVRHRPIADPGLTTRRWPVNLTLQSVLAVSLYAPPTGAQSLACLP